MPHPAFLQEATMLTCPVSSGVEAVGADFDNPSGSALTCRLDAIMYGAPEAMVNCTGVERDQTFWGGSRIIAPFGREVVVAGQGEEMSTPDLDYELVRSARQRYRVGAARNRVVGRYAERT